MIVLGIDGGATKTYAQISDETLSLLGEGFAQGSNYQESDPETAANRIKEALDAASKAANLVKIAFDRTCLGLSGLDTEKDFEVMKEAIARNLGHVFKKPPIILNDTKIAFYAGSDSDFGLVLIAGTGSNLWGRNKEGKEVYVSGLGSILSDQGSAYEMGIKALRIAVKSFDGRAEYTILEEEIPKNLGVKNMREVKDVVYSPAFDKSKVAQIAPIVSAAEEQGDWAGRQIIAETSDELAQIVYAAVSRLKLESEVFDLVLSGTVIQNEVKIRERFEEKVKSFAPKVNFIIPSKPASFGALKIALQAQ